MGTSTRTHTRTRTRTCTHASTSVWRVWYSPECAQETAYAALRIERNNVAQVEEACRANYIVTHAAAAGCLGGGEGSRLVSQCVMPVSKRDVCEESVPVCWLCARYLCIDGWVGVIAARRVDCLLLFLCGRLYELIAEICPCCYCRYCCPVGEMIERNYKRMSTIRT